MNNQKIDYKKINGNLYKIEFSPVPGINVAKIVPRFKKPTTKPIFPYPNN